MTTATAIAAASASRAAGTGAGAQPRLGDRSTRDQSPATRTAIPVLERTSSPGRERPAGQAEPLANTTSAEVWTYIRENEVPHNELHAAVSSPSAANLARAPSCPASTSAQAGVVGRCPRRECGCTSRRPGRRAVSSTVPSHVRSMLRSTRSPRVRKYSKRELNPVVGAAGRRPASVATGRTRGRSMGVSS